MSLTTIAIAALTLVVALLGLALGRLRRRAPDLGLAEAEATIIEAMAPFAVQAESPAELRLAA